MENKEIKLIKDDGKRVDGRLFNELRQIKMEVGVLEKSDGSAYIEQGKTKIFAAVFGPKELHPRHLALPDRAVINCRYHMASFSVEERKQLGMTRREIELSKVIRHALETVIFLEKFPRAGIDVFIEVIQADGGTRVAGLNAASLALADAGIYMRDLVVGCAVGKVNGKIVLDLCDIEDKNGEADMPIAFSPRLNSILLLQLNGKISMEEFNEAIKLAKEGCMKIYELMKETLKKKYSYAIMEEE